MVDYSSLENYRTERYRGFESLSLRKIKGTDITDVSPFFLVDVGTHLEFYTRFLA